MYLNKHDMGELSWRLVSALVFSQFTGHDAEVSWHTAGEIAKEEYDKWRYNYPKYDATGHWHKVPSQELCDAMVDAFNDN